MKNFSELFSAFDYIDEVIYICDMETYDLVYCNKKLEENLLAEYHPNQMGDKCYKCLHGLDHPCVFCNNDNLRSAKRCIWSRLNPTTGKYYLLHDSVLTIDGRDYRMELAVDATHLEEAAAQTRQKLDMETHLTNCIRNLVKSEHFSEAVSAVLQTVLNYYGGERAYLFEFNRDKNVASNTFEICAKGVKAEIDNLQNVPLEHMRFWLDIFSNRSIVVIEDLESLKDDPTRLTEYEDLHAQGIKSLIAVPILSDDGYIGFVGVDNPSANFDNTALLSDLAYFLGVEIGKNHVVRELQDLSYRDPLTSAFNRKGFEQITSKMADSNQPFGFLVADIDNFKMLNDTYGHGIGDDVLKEITKLMTSVFRSDDTVFRLGGDEFAVILTGCTAEAWKTICSKIQWIHTSMSEMHRKVPITLSVGICFAVGAYEEEVYRLADEALYNTKKSGRAGCTMINKNTGEIFTWHDDALSAHSRAVLNYNSTGLFQIEYPLCEGGKPRMICGSAVKEMFAFPEDANAETCYTLWKEGIEQSYIEVLQNARRQLVENVQAECTYRWNHPQYGWIYVRTIGNGEVEDGVQNIYGYHHSMKDTRILEKVDESQLLLEAISSIYFGSYYVNLDNDTYSTIKYAPNERFLKVTEKDAQKSLLNFVSVLARESDHEKMMRFVDLSTLAERMEGETHLDCEYYAVKEKKWCRATFIPVKTHEDGTLSHVLFEVAPLDYAKALETEENAQNKRTVESLYNHVPGGLVMYEWDGIKLKTLHISRFYEEMYGDSLLSRDGENAGGPNFKRVHPDDREGLQSAIWEGLTKTHSLEYVYRGWNNEKKNYVWVKINAVCEPQEDGTSLVYALYSDVTGQKEAELKLAKKHASLVAALGASDQLCYEYDPVMHTEVCLTEDNTFFLPRYVENYPESILNLVHPEDRQTFLTTVHSMDNGREEAKCNARLLRDGEYVWYAYQLQSLYDSERGRPVVSISIMDCSEHMATIQNYQARMNMMMGMTDETMSFCTINVSKNTFSVVRMSDTLRAIAEKAKTFEEFFRITVQYIVGDKDQTKYKKLFSRESLLAKMKQGQTHVYMDYMYRTSPLHVEWVRTSVDMLHNPSSGDIVGVCYSKSIQNEQVSKILLEKVLQRDYPLAAIAEVKSDRYYLFDPGTREYGVQKDDFWQNIARNLALVMDDYAIAETQRALNKEHILQMLEESNVYQYSFDALMHGEMRRMEVKFYYIDSNREMLLAALRDITDSVIMEKLRHDNERDHLTELYNRRKTFEDCETLLKQHPDDRFAMLHFDIRHFRLYNTFFGDAAGDKLLCDIADMFRNMEKDYEYWTYGRIESDVFCVFFPIDQNKYQKHLHDLLHGLQDYRPDFLIEPAIGIYVVTDRSMSIESMFTRASIAAKTVRSGVTNAVVFYDESMEMELADEQQVINDMQTALEQEQFKVYLQPKYSLKTQKPVGAEALVRWLNPQKGLVPPSKFIPIFERNGFIANLDRYMWEHVCALLRKWQEEGYAIKPVSVNVSRISMYSPTTVGFLKDLVRRYGIAPEYLELELTESAYMDDPSEMKKQLKELQDYGFHILMDDFGSSYSSLNTLRELPVNCLKLDKEFLAESSIDERGSRILASIVRMSRMLNLTIIAEGVETPEQAEFLRGLGCEYVQGFLFAKPMPVEEFERTLLKNAVCPSAAPQIGKADAAAAPKDIESSGRTMDELGVFPAVLFEYQDGAMTYLRLNTPFLTEFGLCEDACMPADILREHLPEADYARVLRACEKCAESGRQVCTKVTRICGDGTWKNYLVQLENKGKSGSKSLICMILTNATESELIL